MRVNSECGTISDIFEQIQTAFTLLNFSDPTERDAWASEPFCNFRRKCP